MYRAAFFPSLYLSFPRAASVFCRKMKHFIVRTLIHRLGCDGTVSLLSECNGWATSQVIGENKANSSPPRQKDLHNGHC
ncbi:hypothetical protein BX666DRAFT_1961253 [Dichotomocladium elegans]|nr:hypothetical protein BX666DRAFT_1961253 [Dichotomocladium elegans]